MWRSGQDDLGAGLRVSIDITREQKEGCQEPWLPEPRVLSTLGWEGKYVELAAWPQVSLCPFSGSSPAIALKSVPVWSQVPVRTLMVCLTLYRTGYAQGYSCIPW